MLLEVTFWSTVSKNINIFLLQILYMTAMMSSILLLLFAFYVQL